MIKLGRLTEAVATCRGVMEAYPGTSAAKSAHEFWREAIKLAEAEGYPKENLKSLAAEYEAYKRFLRDR